MPTLTPFTHRLEDNRLNGSLPDDWSGLGNLQTLQLGNNLLVGTLPGGFAALGALRTLSLRRNTLVGTLPAAWSAGLGNLTLLDLSRNALVGTLPASWAAWVNNLADLWLNINWLSGEHSGGWEEVGGVFAGVLCLWFASGCMHGLSKDAAANAGSAVAAAAAAAAQVRCHLHGVRCATCGPCTLIRTSLQVGALWPTTEGHGTQHTPMYQHHAYLTMFCWCNCCLSFPMKHLDSSV
jgi:hypothetical protein